MHLKWPGLWGLVFFWCFTLKAQVDNIQFERLNLPDGLSQGTIYCMLQDQKGFMWFGTQDGLNKYDGYAFTVYRYEQEDSASISDNFIQDIYEDREGYIWIATLSEGLNRFDRSTERFTRYRHRWGDTSGLSSNKVTEVFEDSRQHLWVGTSHGLDRMGDTEPEFIHYEISGVLTSGIADVPVTAIYEDIHGNLWVGTEKGLNQYDVIADAFRPLKLSEDEVADAFITALGEDSQGNLLVGTRSGLYQSISHPSTTSFKPVEFPTTTNNQVNTILTDPNGTVWIGFEDAGMILWDMKQDRLFHIRNDPSSPRSLSNNLVNDLLYDTFGNLWVGTLNGINKCNINNFKFDLYQNKPGMAGHTSNSVFGIAKDQSGGIWTVTREGVFYLDRTVNKLQEFNDSPNSHPRLSGRAYRSVYHDPDGMVWLGSVQGILDRLDPVNKTVSSFELNPQLNDNTIYVIYEDTEAALWLGTASGLYSFDKETLAIQYFDMAKPVDAKISNSEIRAIAGDSKENLWLATLGSGLFHFDVITGAFTQHAHDPENPYSISGNTALSLYIDKGDTLWISTTLGFNKFHPSESKFYRFSEKDGLANDVVYGVLHDGDHLWLSTNNGLSRFHRNNETFRNYQISDGLQGSEFNGGAYHRSADGELFFGGIDGYNAFYPAAIKDNQQLPSVLLTGFKVFNEDRSLDQSLESLEEIQLSYRDVFFSFEFAALHLVASEKNQYAYMMEGFDRDWIYSTRRFASYTNLDPGTYTFRVKASNNDGIWNENGLSVKVVIAPPFWQAWWFYVMALLLVGTLVYAFYRYRIAQVRKEEKLKTEFNKKLAEVEMTALRAQMNPHFLFNCLNSINRYIVKSDPETASDYLTKFSRLIRLILQNSKSPTVTLESELEALQLYIEMEEVRFDEQFSYSIEVDESIETNYLEVPPMILQPYVENAIWHGLMHKESKGELLIEIRKEKEWLRCTIEDNGIGREKAQELKSKSATRKKSMGMKITRDRLSLVNHMYNQKTKVDVIDLQDSNGKASGTRVVVHIPVMQESWPATDLSLN